MQLVERIAGGRRLAVIAFQVNSALIVVASVVAIARAIAQISLFYDPCLSIALAPISLIIAALGAAQYQAAFRHCSGAARWAAIACCTFALPLVVSAIAMPAELWANGDSLDSELWFLLIPLVAGCYLLVSAAANVWWGRTIRRENRQTEIPPSGTWLKLSLRELLFGVTMLSVFAGLTIIFREHTLPPVGVDRAPDETPVHVPSGASRVSYYFLPTGPVKAYEFDIDEDGFLRWAESVRPKLSSGVEETLNWFELPRTIQRYTSCIDNLTNEPTEARIVNGYYYEWAYTDQGVYFGYDADKQRAYFFAHSR